MWLELLSEVTLVVPVSLLLTICFFVMFALKKAETKFLKNFGYIVLSLLLVSTLLVLVMGVVSSAIGRMQNAQNNALRSKMLQSQPLPKK
jgi:hypothetical protein